MVKPRLEHEFTWRIEDARDDERPIGGFLRGLFSMAAANPVTGALT
jgi:hypothetical protein